MEKTQLVNEVFDVASPRYDLMNDIMSFGTHRFLKSIFRESTGVHPGNNVLDVAGGTGDISLLLAPVVGSQGSITILDINESMLRQGRDRLLDAGFASVNYILADAESMPISDESYDCITIAFGIRNMSHMDVALAECWRVLRVGGRLSVLEFSHPKIDSLRVLFNIYRQTWPVIGQFVVGDSNPYRYLVESIDRHPSAEAMDMFLESAGFRASVHHSLLGGIVTIHRGVK
ncbi:MAG: class I SAM-dependent methyltransferase [Gammaproteobacteria bacterium]|nr:class I SAM-dependent methyltransferase [Gammaproteobacteria bacterium]MYF38677.1 class I SAM-dependent methyltransferase [Gammaproteobacteria bacterium]